MNQNGVSDVYNLTNRIDSGSNNGSVIAAVAQYSKRARTGVTPTKIHESKRIPYQGRYNSSSLVANESKICSSKIFKTKSAMSNPQCIRHTNDEVHATIDFCPVLSALIDTPPFQRLRDLKQLGTAQYVYCNANHSRFEHSLGVAHLAEKVLENILSNQYHVKEKTTQKDVLCVKLAGLFHDIGHGPFSHMYEEFVHNYLPDFLANQPPHKQEFSTKIDWTHESSSLDMIDMSLSHLGLKINIHKLDEPLEQIGDGIDALSMRCYVSQPEGMPQPDDMILTSRDWIFIKECIVGGPLKGFDSLVGRPDRHQEWLYDIVSNHHSGLDVDKIDYFARDARRCFGEAGEVDKVFIKEAAVAWGKCTKPGGKCKCYNEVLHCGHHLMICYPVKTVRAALGFFKRRFELHEKIYQHKTVLASGILICDIFCKADRYFQIRSASDSRSSSPKSDDKPFTLSTAMRDPGVYLKLRDSIVDVIEFTTTPELHEARSLIQRLRSHDFYKLACRKTLDSRSSIHDMVWQKKEFMIKEEMLAIYRTYDSVLVLKDEDFVIKKGSIHHGLKEKNPLSNMRFFRREEKRLLNKSIDNLPVATIAPEDTYRAKLPTSFIEQYICAFSRDSSKTDIVSCLFEEWWENNVEALVAHDMNTDRNAPREEEDDDEDEDGFCKRNGVPTCTQESDYEDDDSLYE